MVFIFLIANRLHAENIALRNERAALRVGTATGDAQVRPSVRDVAAQLLAAHKAVNPRMQNMVPIIAKYLGAQFADPSIFEPTSIDGLRANALIPLMELRLLATDYAEQAQGLQQTSDYYNITLHFDHALTYPMDLTSLKLFMAVVMETHPSALPATTFVIACNLLTTAWLNTVLCADETELPNTLPALAQLTSDFVQRFAPHDYSGNE